MKYSHTSPAVGKLGSCAAAFEKNGLEIFTRKFIYIHIYVYIAKKKKHLEDVVVVRIEGLRARTKGNSSTMDSEWRQTEDDIVSLSRWSSWQERHYLCQLCKFSVWCWLQKFCLKYMKAVRVCGVSGPFSGNELVGKIPSIRYTTYKQHYMCTAKNFWVCPL